MIPASEATARHLEFLNEAKAEPPGGTWKSGLIRHDG